MTKRVKVTIVETFDDGSTRTTDMKVSAAERKIPHVLKELDQVWMKHNEADAHTKQAWEHMDRAFDSMERMFDSMSRMFR